MPSPSDHRRAALLLAACSAAALAIMALRVVRTGDPGHGFLVWNLFLAWIPLVLGWMLWRLPRAGASRLALAATGVAWLLFLPNAPYIVTDLVHLHRGQPHLLLDLAMIGTFATAGMLL